LGDCSDIPLTGVDSLSVEIEATYDASATADPGITVHVRTSPERGNYDTEDYTSFDVALDAGATVRKTANVVPNARYAKVLVENLTDYDITDVTVRTELGK